MVHFRFVSGLDEMFIDDDKGGGSPWTPDMPSDRLIMLPLL